MFLHLLAQHSPLDVLPVFETCPVKPLFLSLPLVISPSDLPGLITLVLAIWAGNLGSPTSRWNLNPTGGPSTTDLKGEWISPTKQFQLLVYLKWLPN